MPQKRLFDNDPYNEGTRPKKILFDTSEQGRVMDIRTLEQIREYVRTKWRSCETVVQFSKLANLDPVIARRLESDYSYLDEDVHEYICELAMMIYIVVKGMIEEKQWKGIQWIEPPETENKQDRIVSLYYVDLLRVETRRMARRDEAEKYYDVLKQVIPTPPITPRLLNPLGKRCRAHIPQGYKGRKKCCSSFTTRHLATLRRVQFWSPYSSMYIHNRA